MELRRIGVYLKDAETAMQLADYWKRKASQYRFEVFLEEAQIRELVEGEPLYLLITEESCFIHSQNLLGELQANRRIGRLVLLTGDHCASCVVEGETIPCVYRYQSADRILADAVGMRDVFDVGVEKKALFCLEEFDPVKKEEGARLPVIGIYSPVGRCGKSRFALTLGRILAEQGRVLYLSLEVFSDLYEWTVSSGAGDFSDLIYYEELGMLTAERFRQLSVEKQGLSIVGPAVNPEDITGLTKARCERVLCCAKEAGYETVVLDVGSQHPDPVAILDLCKTVYAPVTGEDASRLKWQHFMKYVKSRDREALLDRIETIRLPEASREYLAGGLPEGGERLEAFVRRLVCCKN